MEDDKYLEELLGSVESIDGELEELAEPIEGDDEELKSLLGNIVNDAKNETSDKKLTPEELEKINGMDSSEEKEDSDIKLIDVEEKGKKRKKAKKEKKPKKKKEPKNSEEGKEPKEKKNIKKVISDIFFEEVEDDEAPEKSSVDKENQMILDELDDAANDKKKGKKPKKEKPKKEKPKKEKKVKEKKVKPPVDPSEKVQFKPVKLILFVTFVISIVALVMVWTSAFNYYNNVKTAKAYYEKKDYAKAYELIAGMKIQKNDAKFAQKVKQIMFIEKQRNSYYNYKAMGDGVHSIDSLLKAVKVYNTNNENDKKIGVADITGDIYSDVIQILYTEYGINEKDAVYYASLTNYSQYYEILQIYGGNESDSNN